MRLKTTGTNFWSQEPVPPPGDSLHETVAAQDVRPHPPPPPFKNRIDSRHFVSRVVGRSPLLGRRTSSVCRQQQPTVAYLGFSSRKHSIFTLPFGLLFLASHILVSESGASSRKNEISYVRICVCRSCSSSSVHLITEPRGSSRETASAYLITDPFCSNTLSDVCG